MDYIHGVIVQARRSGLYFVKADDNTVYIGHRDETDAKIKQSKPVMFTTEGKRIGPEGREGKYEWVKEIMSISKYKAMMEGSGCQ